MLKRLAAPSFLRNLAVMSLGTAIGQGISVLASPLLTRVYDPAAFGVFGTFSAIVLTLSAIATLRMEQAIIVERERDDALDVWALCIVLAFSAGALTIVASFALQGPIARSLTDEARHSVLWFGGISVLLAGLYNGTHFWNVKHKRFQVLSAYQVARSSSVVAFQYGLSFVLGGAVGLVFGQLLGQILALLIVIVAVRTDLGDALSRVRAFDRLRTMFTRHRDFALFGAPQSVLNALAGNAPTLLLTSFFGIAESGLFWMAYRMLILPNMILVESMRSVLYQRFGQVVHDGASLHPLLRKSSLALFVLCAPVAVALFFLGPMLFAFVFGEAWRDAGRDAAILAWSWAFQNAAVPFGVAATVLRLQRAYFLIEAGALVLRVLALVAGGMAHDVTLALSLFTAAGVVVSLVLIAYVWSKSGPSPLPPPGASRTSP